MRIGTVWARRKDLIYYVLLAAIILYFLSRERRLGLTFPAPWPDEGLFLWQALAIRDTGGLLAPELSAHREVFYMAPGYAVLHGILFKFIRFSLPSARMLSTIYLSGTVACLAYLARRFEARFAHLMLFVAFLGVPICRLAGNTARMETLVTLIGCAGLVLLAHGCLVAGLAVLALAPMFHPNGEFLVLAGMLYVIGRAVRRGLVRTSFRRWELTIVVRPSRQAFEFSCGIWEVALAIAASALWIALFSHFARSWHPFILDIAVQMDWKQTTSDGLGFWDHLCQPGNCIPILLLLMSIAPSLRFARHLLPFFALTSALLMRNLLTYGWLYEYYTALAYLCLALIVLEVCMCALRQGFSLGRGLSALIALAFGVLLGVALFLVGDRSPSLLESVHWSTVPGDYSFPSYWEADDRHAVEKYLRSVSQAPGGPHRVFFVSQADALLFEDLRSSRLRFIQPTHLGFYQADVLVFHGSPWVFEHERETGIANYGLKQGLDVPVGKWSLLHYRQGGDRWLGYQKPPPAPTTPAL